MGNERLDWRNPKPRTKLKKKKHVNIGAEIHQIRSLIEEIKSLLVNWGLKYTNLESRIKIKIMINFKADNWI
jgi:hypothetical protein